MSCLGTACVKVVTESSAHQGQGIPEALLSQLIRRVRKGARG